MMAIPIALTNKNIISTKRVASDLGNLNLFSKIVTDGLSINAHRIAIIKG